MQKNKSIISNVTRRVFFVLSEDWPVLKFHKNFFNQFFEISTSNDKQRLGVPDNPMLGFSRIKSSFFIFTVGILLASMGPIRNAHALPSASAIGLIDGAIIFRATLIECPILGDCTPDTIFSDGTAGGDDGLLFTVGSGLGGSEVTVSGSGAGPFGFFDIFIGAIAQSGPGVGSAANSASASGDLFFSNSGDGSWRLDVSVTVDPFVSAVSVGANDTAYALFSLDLSGDLTFTASDDVTCAIPSCDVSTFGTIEGPIGDIVLGPGASFSAHFDVVTEAEVSTASIDPPLSVPEPGALTLFGIGVVGLGFMRRRRKAA